MGWKRPGESGVGEGGAVHVSGRVHVSQENVRFPPSPTSQGLKRSR